MMTASREGGKRPVDTAGSTVADTVGDEPRRVSAFGLEALPGSAELGTSEYIHRQILDAVLSQRLRPGARLTELALADIFSIGRSTVRDVLQRLALEGVVDVRANRGATVSEPPPDEVHSLFEARRLIECDLVSRAAAAVGTGELEAAAVESLLELTRSESGHLAAGRRGAALRIACEFHVELARFGGVPPLLDALERQVIRTALAIGLYERPAHGFDAALSRQELVRPVASGDPRAARRAMRTHLDALERSLDPESPGLGGDLGAAFRHLTPR